MLDVSIVLSTLTLLAIVHRLRGWGEVLWGNFTRRLLWGFACALAVGLNGGTLAQFCAAWFGGFAGMWISHSLVYFSNTPLRFAGMSLVGAARCALLVPLSLATSWAMVLIGGVVVALSYMVGCLLQFKWNKLKDQLTLSEVLAGLVYGLYVCTVMRGWL